MALAVRQDTQADFGSDGNYVPLSINANGELRVTSSGGSSGTTNTRTTNQINGISGNSISSNSYFEYTLNSSNTEVINIGANKNVKIFGKITSSGSINNFGEFTDLIIFGSISNNNDGNDLYIAMDEKFSITEVDSDKYINVNLSISPEFIKIRNQNDTQSYTLSMLTVISFPFS